MSAVRRPPRAGDALTTVYAWTDSVADHTYFIPDDAVLGPIREDARRRRRSCPVPFVWCVTESRRQDGRNVAWHETPLFRAAPRGPLAFRLKVVFRRDGRTVSLRLILHGEPGGEERKTWRIVIIDYAEGGPTQLAGREVSFVDQLNHLVFDSLPLAAPAGAPDMLAVRLETGPAPRPDGAAPVGPSAQLADDMLRVLMGAATSGDVVLRAEGRDLRAHRCILSGRSAVFSRMFHSPMRESREGLVVVEDVAFDTLRLLVSYLYSGRVAEPLSPEAAMELFVAADRYQVVDLRDGCAEAMLGLSTCVPALVLADALGDARLWSLAAAFFFTRRREVCARPDWAAPLESRPHLMRRLMELMAAEQD